MVKRLKSFLIFFPAFLLITSPVFGATFHKYAVIVNPVREKTFWKSQKLVERQIKVMEENSVPSTWLLQYSVIKDVQTSSLFKNLSLQYEIGVLLEVNEELANDSSVPYLLGRGDWARADKVLLSGYEPMERKRMIIKIFDQFKQVFGEYPKSVGAWYIDTDSLNYLVNKYGVKSAMEVADQYQTDTYGVWGKPWGTPYFPSKYNSSVPAQISEDQLDLVTIQWAARDPVLGYGLTVYDSTYSVQANDYVNHHGLNTDYFSGLAESYLNSSNTLSQLTIGLEAGQEGALFLDELERQIIRIKETVRDSVFVTMADFASIFNNVYRRGNPAFYLTGNDPYQKKISGYWFSSPFYRAFFLKKESRFILNDLRIYQNAGIFHDLFEKDGNERLLREIPACIDALKLKNQKVMFEDLAKIDAKKKEESLEFDLTDGNGKVRKLIASLDNIYFDGNAIIGNLEKNSVRELVMKKLLEDIFAYESLSGYDFKGGIRYSRLNGQWYFGWMKEPEQLAGITSKFPFFGIFRFPFQTLSYFKPLPKINFAQSALRNFVPLPEMCTINL